MNPPTKPSAELIDELQSIPAGYVDTPLFTELARLSVLVALECVPVRLNPYGDVEVLLTLRPDTDPYWPSLYHNPGTMLRPTDIAGSLTSSKERIAHDELAGATIVGDWYFHKLYLLSAGRGMALGLVSYIEVSDSPVGTYFTPDQLPPNIIQEQIDYIRSAAIAFSTYKRGELTPILLESLF